MIQFRCELCEQISGADDGPRELAEIDLEKSVFTFSESPVTMESKLLDNEAFNNFDEVFMCPRCFERTDTEIYSEILHHLDAIKKYRKLYKEIGSTNPVLREIDCSSLEKQLKQLEAKAHALTVRYNMEIETKNKLVLQSRPEFDQVPEEPHFEDGKNEAELNWLRECNDSFQNKNAFILDFRGDTINGISRITPDEWFSELIFVLHLVTVKLIRANLFATEDYKLISIYREPKIHYRGTDHKIDYNNHPMLIQFVREIWSQLVNKKIVNEEVHCCNLDDICDIIHQIIAFSYW